MSPKEFLKKVRCLECNEKIYQDSKTAQDLTICPCRSARHMTLGTAYRSNKFALGIGEYLINIDIWEDKRRKPFFYISTTERPFYPLIQDSEIPDYIFIPKEKLIDYIELLTTFS